MNPDKSFQAGIPTREIRTLFADATVRASVIRPGNPIDQMQVDFATEIVTPCARLVDRYPNPECTEDTIGDVITGQPLEL
jgi:hypothetical protein